MPLKKPAQTGLRLINTKLHTKIFNNIQYWNHKWKIEQRLIIFEIPCETLNKRWNKCRVGRIWNFDHLGVSPPSSPCKLGPEDWFVERFARFSKFSRFLSIFPEDWFVEGFSRFSNIFPEDCFLVERFFKLSRFSRLAWKTGLLQMWNKDVLWCGFALSCDKCCNCSFLPELLTAWQLVSLETNSVMWRIFDWMQNCTI